MVSDGPQDTPIFGDAHPSANVATRSLSDLVAGYLDFYASGQTHTARAKRLDCDRFLTFLKVHRKASSISDLVVQDWDFSATQGFVDHCLTSGEAPATVSRRLATLKHMGRVVAERVPGLINPARDVKPPRVEALRPKSISRTEIEEVRDRAAARRTEKSSFNRQRNEMLLNLLLDTGLRADEVRCLKRGQINAALDWIEKVRTKGRRFRSVYITSAVRESLRNYLELRSLELARFFPKLAPATDGKLPLFISVHGAKVDTPASFEMSPKSVWRAIRECSVDTKLHPHLLRHTYAIELVEESHDVRLVAQALGHSDVRVTMRYTERANEEVAAALERTRTRSSKD